MSTDTQYREVSTNTYYQAVSTNTTSNRRKGQYCRCVTVISGVLVGLSIFAAIPITVFYGLECYKRNSFNEQPNYCRINSYDKHIKLGFLGAVIGYEWNVDIAKEPKSIDILRSNITSLAWHNPEITYSIGGVYPCYVHKGLLSNDPTDRKRNPRFAIQWEKPRKLTAIIWFCVGLAFIISAVIFVLVAVLVNHQ